MNKRFRFCSHDREFRGSFVDRERPDKPAHCKRCEQNQRKTRTDRSEPKASASVWRFVVGRFVVEICRRTGLELCRKWSLT